jgi:hypothetical protein
MNIENCKTVSITKLKEWGYLNDGIKSGIISWSTSGDVHSRINIKCTILTHKKFITLDYNQNGESINYDVQIISIPSNLGKGEILYFICPNTKKRCRKLYHNSKYFLHREAFKYLYYEKQNVSKKTRSLHFIFDRIYLKDEVFEEQYKKHFKPYYNGKPTKRYQKILDKIRLSENYPVGTLERLLLM